MNGKLFRADNSTISNYNAVFEKKDWIAIVLMCTSFVFWGHNTFFDYLIITTFMICSIILFYNGVLEFAFIPIVFFGQVLSVPYIGSFLQIYLVLFLIYLILRKSCTIIFPNKAIIYIVFLLMVIISSNFLTIVAMLVKLSILYCISSNCIRIDTYRNNLLKVVSISAFFSCVYGFFFGSELYFSYGIRHSGSVDDPNYSAFLFVLGIVSLICCRWNSRIIKYGILIVLLFSLVRTVSLTGIIVLFVSLTVFVLVKNWKVGIIVIAVLTIATLVFLSIPFADDSLFYGIQYRVNNSIGLIQSNNYDSLTSGRASILAFYLEHFFSTGFLGKLFGINNNLINVFHADPIDVIGFVPHNSYVDILMSNGFLGLTYVVCIFVYGVYTYLKMYFHNYHDNTYIGLALIKIVTILFCFSISIYPASYFVFALFL